MHYHFLFITGTNQEREIDMLRSILAQMEFCYTVRQYDERGIPLRTHLHIPENHPDSGMTFLERDGHVLKVYPILTPYVYMYIYIRYSTAHFCKIIAGQ